MHSYHSEHKYRIELNNYISVITNKKSLQRYKLCHFLFFLFFSISMYTWISPFNARSFIDQQMLFPFLLTSFQVQYFHMEFDSLLLRSIYRTENRNFNDINGRAIIQKVRNLALLFSTAWHIEITQSSVVMALENLIVIQVLYWLFSIEKII